MKTLTEAEVREALATVMDPEIPVVSIVDLGIVERVEVSDVIEVDLLPTFSGCPALDVIREDVERALAPFGIEVRARFVTSPAWTTERMTPRAREALGEFGISPPVVQIGRKPAAVTCPYCGAGDTVEESAFGPTLCRTIRYCSACKNPFEGFKVKG